MLRTVAHHLDEILDDYTGVAAALPTWSPEAEASVMNYKGLRRSWSSWKSLCFTFALRLVSVESKYLFSRFLTISCSEALSEAKQREREREAEREN